MPTLRDLLPLSLGLALAACGGDDGNDTTPDAAVGNPDAADTTPDAAQPGTVDVHVFDDVLTGMHVVFQNADDTVVADVVPDADGLASAEMLAGGSVTLVRTLVPLLGGANVGSASTYLGVQPGDELEFGYPPGSVLPQTTMAVTVPAYGGASAYDVSTPCGGTTYSSSPVTVTLTGCGATTDVFVAARDVNGAYLATFLKPAQTVGATLTFSNAADYKVVKTTTYDITGLPASVNGAGANVQLYPNTSSLGWPVQPNFGDGAQPTAGEVNISGPLPDLSAGLMLADIGVSRSAFGYHEYYSVGAIDYANSFDVGAHPIPWLAGPVLDAQTGTILWTQTDDGTLDVVQGSIGVNQPDGSGGTNYVQRFAVAPGSAQPELRFPVLPADYDVLNIAPEAVLSGIDVQGFRSDEFGEAIRTKQFGPFDPGEHIPAGGATFGIAFTVN